MICIFGGAVGTVRTGYSTLMSGIGIFRPCTVDQVVVCDFGGTVTTGAAYRPLVLGRTGGRPGTIGQRMACIFIGGIAAITAGG